MILAEIALSQFQFAQAGPTKNVHEMEPRILICKMF